MAKTTWKLLENVNQELVSHRKIQPSFFKILASRIQSTLDSKREEEIVSLAKQLDQMLKQAYSISARDVASKLSEAISLEEPIESAYILGQLSFAHQLATVTAGTRIGDKEMSRAKDQRFRPYLQALLDAPLSGTELADICGQRPETVSRNIGELRELGIVDYRRQGTAFVNFLTPLGRAFALSVGLCPSTALLNPKSEELEKMRNEVSPAMRSFPVIGMKQRLAA